MDSLFKPICIFSRILNLLIQDLNINKQTLDSKQSIVLIIFCSQRALVELDINDNKKVNAGGYTSSSSANSDETVRLLDHSNLNESSNSDFWSLEDDKNKENDSDKGYKTK